VRNLPCPVIDSNEILLHPKKALQNLCNQLKIPFEPKMLTWKKGPLPEDGVWSKYWYKTVHESTGFEKRKKTLIELNTHNANLYEIALPYYTSLKKNEFLNNL
jgi:hypothetical protein